MKLYSIRGGNSEMLYGHGYNIGIGISLGNKWFTPENISALIKWSLEYTKEYVVVYVADWIHSINIEVRKKVPRENAQKKALALGEKVLQEIKTFTHQEMQLQRIDKIRYSHWSEILTQKFCDKVEYLYEKYNQDLIFRNQILKFLDNNLQNESRKFSVAEKQKLGTYLIEELPELINRVYIGGVGVDASIYPFDNEVFKFVEDIQNGFIFPEIKEKILDTEPKVFLEVRE